MRSFVAIEIPDDIRNRIGALIGKLKPTAPNLRWSRAEGLHITLKFLGEVPPATIGQVKRQLATVTMTADLSISIEGTGYFPNASSPRVVWLGINAAPGLAALASNVEAAMAVLGFETESRAFSPHLTLARTNGARIKPLQEALLQMQPLNLGSFKATEFFLYESRPRTGGSEYIKIARFGISSGASN